MQTFLPFTSFTKSARCLDNKRLGKQRVEVLQLLNALSTPGAGWSNHPAAKMWRGYEPSLAHYGLVICTVWVQDRKFRDTCFGKIKDLANMPLSLITTSEKPWWFGNQDFHRSHQSNLYRKDPEYYAQFADVGPDLEYVWPVN